MNTLERFLHSSAFTRGWAAGLMILACTVAVRVEAAGIRLETSLKSEPLNLTALEAYGKEWITVKTAVEYLDGRVTWQDVTRKLLIQGPSGREVVMTVGMPKLVVDHKTFVRLPHHPRMIRGRVMITPESLVVLWHHAGEQDLVYNAEQKVFRVGSIAPPSPSPGNSGPSGQAVVVIDAGHGGKDPGAIGPSRLQEKTVTLEIAQQVANYLHKRGVKVIMTRGDDRFFSLKERADIANRAKADLFVSIHANASKNRSASGSQVFIYNREASSTQAADAARLENQDANYLEIIKDDLRQSIHESSSITAAGLVSQEFEKMGLSAKRIERAPFYVLAKSHMPSILVETAFISHNKEERLLRSRGFCQKLAAAIDHGIQQYDKEKRQAQIP